MLKIGTLVLYKNDDEPCLGVVVGEAKSLTDSLDEEDLEDFQLFRDKVFPVKWGDMQGVCCEQPENLIIISEVE
jgi:hypothetical protein